MVDWLRVTKYLPFGATAQRSRSLSYGSLRKASGCGDGGGDRGRDRGWNGGRARGWNGGRAGDGDGDEGRRRTW